MHQKELKAISLIMVYLFIMLGSVYVFSKNLENSKALKIRPAAVNIIKTTPSAKTVLKEKAFPTPNKISDMPKRKAHLYNICLDEKWQKLIHKLCTKNNLDEKLVLALFDYESEGYQLDLISYNRDSHDMGIAQINSKVLNFYKNLGVKYCDLDPNVNFDPLNPDHGIRAGIGGLVYYRNEWQGKVPEEDLAYYIMNSYNMGMGSYKRYIERTGKLSRGYDREVFKRVRKLKSKD
ncbi:MAG: transglycosylase SLT domain-containing protein [Clostridia bacterium]|nr:transglycosylase SLT domain-containing protein [Clostridia bacterium]